MTERHSPPAAARWGKFTFRDQLLMIGTELKRLQHWRSFPDETLAANCAARADDLLELTIATVTGSARRELCRAREVLRAATTLPNASEDVSTLLRTLVGNL